MILGIETATSICSVGLVDDDHLVAELRFNIKNIHAEILAESIQQLLNLSGLTVQQMAAFAISIGPGSFTGLRIGLATAKGLAFASGKPLLAVSTLQAQAAACSQYLVNSNQWSVPVVPVIKAKQEEVYTARFRNDWPAPIAESEEVLLKVQNFPKWLQAPALLCGNGVALLQACGIFNHRPDLIIIPEAAAMLSGGLVARLAAKKWAAGENTDWATLEPRYLQEFEIGPKKTP